MNDAETSLGTILSHETVAPGEPWSGTLEAGSILRIVHGPTHA